MGSSEGDVGGRLGCPFCEAYQVDRLYLASVRVDSCICLACGARWDEDASTGAYKGRESRAHTTPTHHR